MTTPAYVVNEQHRNGNPSKSQWLIPPLEEEAAFRLAHERGWLLPNNGWSLHLNDGQPEYLGVAQDRERKLILAKYVVSNTPPLWHGYPADHQAHPQDIPDEVILASWLSQGILPAQKVRKIARAQRCKL